MTMHMEINSPEMLRQHEAKKARLRRLGGVAQRERQKTPVRKVVVMGDDAKAHVRDWQHRKWVEENAGRSDEPPIALHRPHDAHVHTFRLFSELSNVEPSQRVLIETVIRETCLFYEISRADLLSQRRTLSIIKPRQIAMYLAKVMTLRSMPEIGRRFGGRDHTTALHAVRKIGDLVASDAALAAEVEALRRQIESVSDAGA